MTKPTFSLNDEFQTKGTWWVPPQTEVSAPGTLRFSPDGGAVLDLWDCPDGWDRNMTTLQGDTDLGGVLLTDMLGTKFGPRSRRTPAGWISSNTLRFMAGKAFVGGYFQSVDEVLFDTYSLTYRQLLFWLEHRPFEEPMRLVSKESGVILNYAAPPEIAFELDDEGTTLAFHYEAVHASRDRFHSEWDFETRVELRSTVARPISWFEERQRRVSTLFAMLSGQPVIPSRIMGVKKADPIIDTILVNVCYEQSAAPERDREEMCRDLLLPYPSMAEHLAEVARRWMELAPTLGVAAEVLYISLVRPLPFTETRFLFMAQAVETLHRRLWGGEHIPTAEYRKLNKRLGKALDDAFPDELVPAARQAIKARLGHANEFTLKDRFLDLLGRLPSDLRAYICNDAEVFAEACKNERNLLTHDPADSIRPPMSDRRSATHTLRWLAVLTILRRLGVPDELLARRLREAFPTEYTYKAEQEASSV